MPFQSGRVTFCRFRVAGDAPQTVDDTALATLAEHSFREREIGAPDEVEAGWTTGEHLLDTQFSYEKNGYGAGNLLLFAIRIDTHRVPSDVKHAYKKINEAALAAENPSGFISKAQRRDATETAQRQMHEDLASGKYRKSKAAPLLWDLQRGVLYCSAPSNKVLEQIASLFFRSFNCKLEPMTAGALAGHALREQGKGRDYEDLHPSPFTPAPEHVEQDNEDAAGPRDLNIPSVPWVQTATDLKDFLGNEFLIWLWWTIETNEGLVSVATAGGKSELAVMIDKSLDMDCAWGALGKQTLRGTGPTRLVEAGDALATGKWPRKAGLILADSAEGSQFELSLQADRWIVSGAALPEVPDAQNPREITEARLESTRQLADTVDGLFHSFLKARTSGGWAATRGEIRKWIAERRRPR